MSIRLTIIFVGLVLCLPASLSPAETPRASLEDVQQGYQEKIEATEDLFERGVEKLAGEYLKKLGELEKKLQRQGDLENFLAVKRERERFEVERELGSSQVHRSLPALGRIQSGYLKSRTRLNDGKGAKLKFLRKTYLEQLRDLESELTRSGDIQGAMAVRMVKMELEPPVAVEPAPEKPAPAKSAPTGVLDYTGSTRRFHTATFIPLSKVKDGVPNPLEIRTFMEECMARKGTTENDIAATSYTLCSRLLMVLQERDRYVQQYRTAKNRKYKGGILSRPGRRLHDRYSYYNDYLDEQRRKEKEKQEKSERKQLFVSSAESQWNDFSNQYKTKAIDELARIERLKHSH